MELGWPLPKRRQHLKELIDQKTEKTHRVLFQGRTQHMPLHNVPLGLPLYRLENGRTTGLQAEYIAGHPDAGEDFFRADTELETAQKAQHDILVKLARGRKDLFKEFQKNTQAEPIILSANGYVINGNRRLSTWRTLYEEDPAKFGHFANVEAVILPHCDEKDLDRLEADLQLKEDLKADYSWTSTALMLKEKIARYGYKEEEIAAIYEMTKKDLKELLDCIEYAEQYLESRNIPRKFSDVDGKEFAFRQICRTRPKMRESEATKELFERAAFCLTDEATEGKRIYAEIPKIAVHIAEVTQSLIVELDIDANGLKEEDLSLRVVEALDDTDNHEKARLVIRDTIEAETVKKKQRKKQDFVACQILKAKANLADALSAIESRSSKKGVVEALSDIEKLAQQLRDWATKDGK